MSKTASNMSLADQIFGQIATRVLSGQYPVGEYLPPERTLADQFGVTRHVVREAVKRAQQAGLVEGVHGGGHRVLDIEATAGLDVLALLAESATFSPKYLRFWISVLEMRVYTGADIARLAAERATPEQQQEILEAVEAMRAAKTDRELLDLDIKMWNIIVIAADNLAYRLALNTLIKITNVAEDIVMQWIANELRETGFQEGVAQAIADRDGDRAAAAVLDTMGRSLDAILAVAAAAKSAAAAEGEPDDAVSSLPTA